MTVVRPAWFDSSPHKEDFVTAHGVRLQYLAWGDAGPSLILIHGLGDNPHLFDDLAPAFMGHFRVIAYARRGHGRSETRPPYDSATLTADLRGLMDALGIHKADLAGYSMGGNEVTEMAATFPDRVGRIVYLDAAYDYAEPEWLILNSQVPAILRSTPAAAVRSLDAFREYYKAEYFAGLEEMQRVEAYIRESVDTQSDGSVKLKIAEVAEAIQTALTNDPLRQYTRVRCPTLAIYAEATLSHRGVDAERWQAGCTWEEKYMAPFREHSINRVKREIPDIEIIRVPGGHNDFLFTSRERVSCAMKRFLGVH